MTAVETYLKFRDLVVSINVSLISHALTKLATHISAIFTHLLLFNESQLADKLPNVRINTYLGFQSTIETKKHIDLSFISLFKMYLYLPLEVVVCSHAI